MRGNVKEISIVIVNWNTKEYLNRCLESIIKDTKNYNTEIIVVDNDSTDGSVEFINNIFTDIKVINNDVNLGFAKGNNIGIKECTGKYVCLINPDVVVLNGCFTQLYKYMEQNPEIGLIGPQILNSEGLIQRSCMSFPTLWNNFCNAFALDSLFPRMKLFSSLMMRYWGHNTICTVNVINGCFWMVRKKAIRQVGLIDERYFMYAEDIDWCKSFSECNWKIVFFPDAKAIHIGAASSSKSPIRFYIEMKIANLKYWEKYHNKASWICLFLIICVNQLFRMFVYGFLFLILFSKNEDVKNKLRRNILCLWWLIKNSNQLNKPAKSVYCE